MADESAARSLKKDGPRAPEPQRSPVDLLVAELMKCGLHEPEALRLLRNPAFDGYSSEEARSRVEKLRDGLGAYGSNLVLTKSPYDLKRNLEALPKRFKAVMRTTRLDREDTAGIVAGCMSILDINEEELSTSICLLEQILESFQLRRKLLMRFPSLLTLPSEQLARVDATGFAKLSFDDMYKALTKARSDGPALRTLQVVQEHVPKPPREPKPKPKPKLPPEKREEPPPAPPPAPVSHVVLKPVRRDPPPTSPLDPSALPPDDEDCRIPLPEMMRTTEPTSLSDLESPFLHLETIEIIRKLLEMDIDMVTRFVRFRPWLVAHREAMQRLFQGLLRLRASRDQLFELLKANTGLVAQGTTPITHVMIWLGRNRNVRLPTDLSNLAIPEDLFWHRVRALADAKIPQADPRFTKALFARTQRDFNAALNPLKVV